MHYFANLFLLAWKTIHITNLVPVFYGFLSVAFIIIFGADIVLFTLWVIGCSNTKPTFFSFHSKPATYHWLEIASIAITSTPILLYPLFNAYCIFNLRLTWWWYLPYFAFSYFDSTPFNGGRRCEWFRNLALWKYSADYFPASIVKQDDTIEYPPDKPYIFGYHPHGICSAGVILSFASEGLNFSKRFPGLKISPCTLNSLFCVPFFREWIMLQGFIGVGRRSMDYVLSKGKGYGVMVVVGGAGEAQHTRHNQHNLILLKRKGLCRQALRFGCRLVPVYCFGENNVFSIYNSPKLLNFMSNLVKKTLGFCLPGFFGRGILQARFGTLPERHPLHVVFGKPIECPQVDHPTTEDVDKLHQHYCESLKILFNEMKVKCLKDPANHELRFIC